jgi:hypothetical protein
MAITTECPQCNARLALGPELQGKCVRCKGCGATFVVGGEGDNNRFQEPPAGPGKRSWAGEPSPRRHREDDEDEDYDDRPRRRRPPDRPVGLIVGLCVGGGLVLVAGIVVAVVLIVNAARRQTPAVAAAPPPGGPAFRPVGPPNFPPVPQLPVGGGPLGWQDFTPPQRDFSVSLPGQPNELKQPLPGGGGMIAVYLVIDMKTGLAYTLNSFTLPAAEQNWPLERNLADFKAGMLAQLPGAQITREAKVQLGGHPGMEFQIEKQAAIGRITSVARVAIVRGRIYSASVAGQGITSATPDVARFFNSFRITAR